MEPGLAFLSTLSLRRATPSSTVIVILRKNFYPRSPCGERPQRSASSLPSKSISIHALLAESDDILRYLFNRRFNFYPRSPCGERRLELFLYYQDNIFLSTLSLRRATDVIAVMTAAQSISIHALLAESDRSHKKNTSLYKLFLSTLSLRRATAMQVIIVIVHTLFLSTLSLRRATQHQANLRQNQHQFLSTLSLRRATRQNQHQTKHKDDFYPRSPCGERPIINSNSNSTQKISIHALLAESD